MTPGELEYIGGGVSVSSRPKLGIIRLTTEDDTIYLDAKVWKKLKAWVEAMEKGNGMACGQCATPEAKP